MINTSTNNPANPDQDTENVNVEQANNTGIGDAGVNGEKLTKYTSNRSADA